MALAEKQGGKILLVRGHAATGTVLLYTGHFAEGLLHYDQTLALYDPVEQRPLATLVIQNPRVWALFCRSLALWALGYPDAGLAGAEQALSEARETGHAGILMHAMSQISLTQVTSGNYPIARAQSDELIALAEEKGSAISKALGMLRRAGVLALTGKASDAVGLFTAAIPVWRSTGSRIFSPVYLTLLARACGELGQFDEAWSYIGEAMTAIETTKETWYEADVHRIAGEIALMSPERDTARAEAYFERALEVARAQQAKSWELRAATSMARLWREHSCNGLLALAPLLGARQT